MEEKKEEVIETIDDPGDSPKEEQRPDVVARDDHNRALSDMKKYKERVQALEEQLEADKVAKLKEREDWQKVAELKEEEATKAKERAQLLERSLVQDKKLSAIRQAALSKGIRKEAVDDLDMLNFDDVQIETTSTGRINVLGADSAVDRLKTLKPHWFGQKSVNVDSGSPEVTPGGTITVTDLTKAQKKAKETGDYAPYEKILRQYQAQSRR